MSAPAALRPDAPTTATKPTSAVRLEDLTGPQRDIILALIRAGRAAAQAQAAGTPA